MLQSPPPNEETKKMQSQAALFPYPLSEDLSTELFADYFDTTMRLYVGRTCRAAHAFFNFNIHNALVVDLRKALEENGFRCSAPDFNVDEIPDALIVRFLTLLKYPYATSHEKLAFAAITRPWNLTNTNLSTWRVGIFCFFLIHDIQTNVPTFDHAFITTKNLFLFKALLLSSYKQFRIHPNRMLLESVLQQPDVAAQPRVGEVLMSDIYRPYTTPSILRLIDLGILPATTSQIKVEDEMGATFKMADLFTYTLIENLDVLYQADRRTAKWASGVIRAATKKDRELLSGHFLYRHHIDNSNNLTCAFIGLQHFPAILPEYFSPFFKHATADAVIRAKKILLSFLINTHEASEARRRCVKFTTPAFLTLVAQTLVAKEGSLIDSCIALAPVLNPPSGNCSPQRFLV
jgi:hypothetical protein